MKAKHIRKIRSRAQMYYVTDDVCEWTHHARTGAGNVLAYYPWQAIDRLRRRHHQISERFIQCDYGSPFLKYMVQPVKQPFERFKTYWR